MATTSTCRLDLKVRAPIVNDPLTPGSDDGAIDVSVLMNSTQVTKRFRRTYSIAASSSQSLDLVSALTDAFGTALPFAKVGWTSNGVPFISAAATTPLSPCYLFVNTSGTTVTGGTGDIILVYNDDASASADIEVLILGT